MRTIEAVQFSFVGNDSNDRLSLEALVLSSGHAAVVRPLRLLGPHYLMGVPYQLALYSNLKNSAVGVKKAVTRFHGFKTTYFFDGYRNIIPHRPSKWRTIIKGP